MSWSVCYLQQKHPNRDVADKSRAWLARNISFLLLVTNFYKLWLKTTHTQFLIVLEVRSLNLNCWKGWVPSGSLGENQFLSLFQLLIRACMSWLMFPPFSYVTIPFISTSPMMDSDLLLPSYKKIGPYWIIQGNLPISRSLS